MRNDVRKLPIKQKMKLRETYYISPNEKILLFVGRIETIKGIEPLMACFEEVLKKFPNCRLVLTGDGNMRNVVYLCKKAWSKVVFTGKIDKNTLNQWYQIADIALFPSYHELCSYVGIEMMMHGLPIVASDGYGVRNMFHDGINAKVAKIEQWDNPLKFKNNLKESIIELLSSETTLLKLKKGAIATYKTKYSIEQMQEGYAQLFDSLFVKDTVDSSMQVCASSIGLFSGKTGLAVYWFHYARLHGDEDYKKRAAVIINEIKALIRTAYISFGYANGLAGTGSALCYLIREHFIELPERHFFDKIDAYFFNRLCFSEHTDISRDTGLIGIGYYFLNRIKDLSSNEGMASLQLRHWLLLVQDTIFARLGMNGYSYPYMKSGALSNTDIVDIKRFLKKMLKTGLCPELTSKALSIINEYEDSEPTIFEKLEDAYKCNNMQECETILKVLCDLPEDVPTKQLAMLQQQDMMLPAWWELF